MTKRKSRSYTNELKQEAVALVTTKRKHSDAAADNQLTRASTLSIQIKYGHVM